MLDTALTSIFGSTESLVAGVSTVDFLLCCLASIVLGAAVALIYMFRHTYSKNFVVTLALLPLIAVRRRLRQRARPKQPPSRRPSGSPQRCAAAALVASVRRRTRLRAAEVPGRSIAPPSLPERNQLCSILH